jgi:glucokinase
VTTRAEQRPSWYGHTRSVPVLAAVIDAWDKEVAVPTDEAVTVGVDLGGTKIQTVAVRDEQVVGSDRVPTPRTGAEDVIDAIVASIRASLKAAGGGEDPAAVRAIGVGSPGEIDTGAGTVSRAANIPGFERSVDLGPKLAAAFGGAPVTVDNDVRVAVVGEYVRGAGQPFKNVLGVFIGTGVGGGLILEGTLRRGRGSAGEIGHTVVKPGGRVCRCGRHGCLEAYAGRMSIEQAARRRQEAGAKTHLFDIMRRKNKDRVTSAVIAAALDEGDDVTSELIDEAIHGLGIALANAQNLLDLEAVIVGGGLGDRLKDLPDRAAKAMVPHLFAPDRAPHVLATKLGDLSGAVGAVVTAGG